MRNVNNNRVNYLKDMYINCQFISKVGEVTSVWLVNG